MPKLTRPWIIPVALALALASCGDTRKTPSDPAMAGAAVTAAVTAAATAGGANGLAASTAELPDFAELPPGAKVIHTMKLDDGGKTGGSVSLEVRQSPAEVLSFYKQAFARHGLKIGIETLSTDMAMLNGQSADESKMLTVMVNATGESSTSLNIVHARKTQ